MYVAMPAVNRTYWCRAYTSSGAATTAANSCTMGNEMSQEEEALFLEEAYKMSLDNPEVDKKLNVGTTAPNCQPKHTLRAQLSDQDGAVVDGQHGAQAATNPDNGRSQSASAGRPSRDRPTGNSPRRSSSENFDNHRMGYVQMARAGYQELVNAIIRPPRADYKVRLALCC